MNDAVWTDERTVAALREEFDGAFARARGGDAKPIEDILPVRLGRDPYALRLSEVAGVHLHRRLVRAPSDVAAFAGVAYVRSAVVAVYDLGVLLGTSSPAIGHGPTPPVLVLARGRPVALAVTSVEGCVRVERERLPVKRAAGQGRAHVVGALPIGGTLTLLVDLASTLETVFEAIDRQSAATRSRKDL